MFGHKNVSASTPKFFTPIELNIWMDKMMKKKYQK